MVELVRNPRASILFWWCRDDISVTRWGIVTRIILENKPSFVGFVHSTIISYFAVLQGHSFVIHGGISSGITQSWGVGLHAILQIMSSCINTFFSIILVDEKKYPKGNIRNHKQNPRSIHFGLYDHRSGRSFTIVWLVIFFDLSFSFFYSLTSSEIIWKYCTRKSYEVFCIYSFHKSEGTRSND